MTDGLDGLNAVFDRMIVLPTQTLIPRMPLMQFDSHEQVASGSVILQSLITERCC